VPASIFIIADKSQSQCSFISINYFTLPRVKKIDKLKMFRTFFANQILILPPPPERLLASAIQTSKIYSDNNFSMMLNGVTDRRESGSLLELSHSRQ